MCYFRHCLVQQITCPTVVKNFCLQFLGLEQTAVQTSGCAAGTSCQSYWLATAIQTNVIVFVRYFLLSDCLVFWRCCLGNCNLPVFMQRPKTKTLPLKRLLLRRLGVY